MLKILLNYNFNPSDIVDEDFGLLFRKRRRDSCFAFVYQKNNEIYAMRDHLGIVPLYFRFVGDEIKFSTSLTPLVDQTCRFDPEGLRYLIAFGTPKLKPLFKEIMIVPPGTAIRIDTKTRRTQTLYRHRIEVPGKAHKCSLQEYVDKLDELLLRAVQRTCRFDKVGLYLSGGIDSALTGIYLKKLGVRVNAYTSAPWGRNSTETPFAKTNAAEIGVDNHFIDFLETSDYKDSVYSIPNLYGVPHGTTTGIGVASLWRNSAIGKEKQIYGAQGCDTINCSVPAQYVSYILNFLPKFVRSKLSKGSKYQNLLQNYLSYGTCGLVNSYNGINEYVAPNVGAVTFLSLAGIYVAHIPSDGEVLSQPVIQLNIPFSNLFYDMDIIEFFLGIPLKFRIGFTRKMETKVYLDKIIVRKLAERYLPKDLVHRKKGFIVSLGRNEETKGIVSDLPSKIFDIPLINDDYKFSAKIFFDWCNSIGVKLNP